MTLYGLKLTGIGTPVNHTDAVNKQYVDQTPFIQLYTTTLPDINDIFDTQWTSVQSN